MRMHYLAHQVTAMALVLLFVLPNPAWALRPQEKQESPSGLEELKIALESGNPDAALRAVVGNLTDFSISPKGGLEESLLAKVQRLDRTMALAQDLFATERSELYLLKPRLEQITHPTYFKTYGIAYIPARQGKLAIIGDLEGDNAALQAALATIGYDPQANAALPPAEQIYLVFVGDYGDFGPHSLDVVTKVLELKLNDPAHVFLIGGNHDRDRPDETAKDVLEHPEVTWFFRQLKSIVGDEPGSGLFDVWRDLARDMNSLVLFPNGIGIMHASPPSVLDPYYQPEQGLMGIANSWEVRDLLSWNRVRKDREDELDSESTIPRFWPGLRKGYWIGQQGMNTFRTSTGVALIARGHDSRGPAFHALFDETFLTVHTGGDVLSPHQSRPAEKKVIGRVALVDLSQMATRWDVDQVVQPIWRFKEMERESGRAQALRQELDRVTPSTIGLSGAGASFTLHVGEKRSDGSRPVLVTHKATGKSWYHPVVTLGTFDSREGITGVIHDQVAFALPVAEQVSYRSAGGLEETTEEAGESDWSRTRVLEYRDSMGELTHEIGNDLNQIQHQLALADEMAKGFSTREEVKTYVQVYDRFLQAIRRWQDPTQPSSIEEALETLGPQEIGELFLTRQQEVERLLDRLWNQSNLVIKVMVGTFGPSQEGRLNQQAADAIAGFSFVHGHLRNLMRDFVNLGGRFDPLGDPVRVNIGDFAVEMGHVLHTSPAAQALQIEVVVEGEHPFLFVDPGRLFDVLENPTLNAARAATTNERIGRPYRIVFRQVDDEVLLEISDKAGGMPFELLVQVLSPKQVTTKSGEAAVGHGVGMNVVREIVEAAGGRVGEPAATDEPGKSFSIEGEGTTYRFYFPALQVPPLVDLRAEAFLFMVGLLRQDPMLSQVFLHRNDDNDFILTALFESEGIPAEPHLGNPWFVRTVIEESQRFWETDVPDTGAKLTLKRIAPEGGFGDSVEFVLLHDRQDAAPLTLQQLRSRLLNFLIPDGWPFELPSWIDRTGLEETDLNHLLIVHPYAEMGTIQNGSFPEAVTTAGTWRIATEALPGGKQAGGKPDVDGILIVGPSTVGELKATTAFLKRAKLPGRPKNYNLTTGLILPTTDLLTTPALPRQLSWESLRMGLQQLQNQLGLVDDLKNGKVRAATEDFVRLQQVLHQRHAANQPHRDTGRTEGEVIEEILGKILSDTPISVNDFLDPARNDWSLLGEVSAFDGEIKRIQNGYRNVIVVRTASSSDLLASEAETEKLLGRIRAFNQQGRQIDEIVEKAQAHAGSLRPLVDQAVRTLRSTTRGPVFLAAAADQRNLRLIPVVESDDTLVLAATFLRWVAEEQPPTDSRQALARYNLTHGNLVDRFGQRMGWASREEMPRGKRSSGKRTPQRNELASEIYQNTPFGALTPPDQMSLAQLIQGIQALRWGATRAQGNVIVDFGRKRTFIEALALRKGEADDEVRGVLDLVRSRGVPAEITMAQRLLTETQEVAVRPAFLPKTGGLEEATPDELFTPAVLDELSGGFARLSGNRLLVPTAQVFSPPTRIFRHVGLEELTGSRGTKIIPMQATSVPELIVFYDEEQLTSSDLILANLSVMTRADLTAAMPLITPPPGFLGLSPGTGLFPHELALLARLSQRLGPLFIFGIQRITDSAGNSYLLIQA